MWQSCALVFLASACTLVIELIAGRIMAPYVGVSLYTWTRIIGIVLAGMSVGNYLGGVVADKRASPRTLGLIFIAGGVSSCSSSSSRISSSARPSGCHCCPGSLFTPRRSSCSPASCSAWSRRLSSS